MSYLSENPETHKKLIKSGVIETISLQISLMPHHDILYHSLKLIYNLSNSNVDRAIEKII